MKILDKILEYIVSILAGKTLEEKVLKEAAEDPSVVEIPVKKEFVMENQITKNFTLNELTYSATAVKKGIENKPTEEHYKNMVSLCKNVLQPLREKLGKPITVNSCYRCPKLNTAVGGVKTSQHCNGQAADIEVMGMSNYDLACYIRDNFEFDQLILEFCDNLKNDKNSGWVHVSYKDSGNRKQTLTINKSGTKLGLVK
jgi:hypothetical protein